MMTEPLINEVSPQQYDFCDISEPRVVALIGAKGSGKTFIGPRFIANCISQLPGSKGIFACSTNRQTEDIFIQDIKPLFDELGWPYDWNRSKGNVTFWNGAILHLRSAESPDRIESIQYDWGWQDEVSLASQKFAKTISSRIRGIRGTGHKRFTSMPDDPEHFIYTWLERICDAFYEVTLYDNPDKEFVKNYERELKETYFGDELKRMLTAARISLAGTGLFAANSSHLKTYLYDPKDDLYLVWDFNVAYRAVTAWQPVGKTKKGIPMMNCIESFQMKEFTTELDAKVLCEHYREHEGLVYLHGDASGENRTAQTSNSMWNQIEAVFEKEFGDRLRYEVPRSNPNVKDTIQVTNWALQKNLLTFSEAARTAWQYLVAAKSDKYGEIDKSNDHKTEGAKSHEVDTIRYLAYLIWWDYFPGGNSHTIETQKLKGF